MMGWLPGERPPAGTGADRCGDAVLPFFRLVGRGESRPAVSGRGGWFSFRSMSTTTGSSKMSKPATIEALLCRGDSGSVALAAPDRPPLTHGGLREQVATIAERFSHHGIGRGSRVAIVLPNGPEMATAFLGVASCAAAAPLNPAYKLDEQLFFLGDLGARALVVLEDHDTAARQAAQQLAIPLIEISVDAASQREPSRLPGARIGTRAMCAAPGPTPTQRFSSIRRGRRRDRSWCR